MSVLELAQGVALGMGAALAGWSAAQWVAAKVREARLYAVEADKSASAAAREAIAANTAAARALKRMEDVNALEERIEQLEAMAQKVEEHGTTLSVLMNGNN